MISDAAEVVFAAPNRAYRESWVDRVVSIAAASTALDIAAGVRDATAG
jgi:hypothetical protein